MMEVTAAALACQRSLRGMQPDQLTALATTAKEVMFPARHRIFSGGGNADKFWLVESGYVTLDVDVPDEGPTIIGRIGIGGLLGWSWLIPPYQWLFGAVCATEVRAIEFSAPTVRDLCVADPALRDELVKQLFEVTALRLRDTTARLTTRDFWDRLEGLDARGTRAMS
jgi:CRP/FNR family transcriptional regulator, cyclic AMP receptor protein